jgi:hypothetical protein
VGVGYFAGRRLEKDGRRYEYGARLPSAFGRAPAIERLLRLGSVFCVETDAKGEPVGLPGRTGLVGERFLRASIAAHRANLAGGEPQVTPGDLEAGEGAQEVGQDAQQGELEGEGKRRRRKRRGGDDGGGEG